jgi:hypothetical protein
MGSLPDLQAQMHHKNAEHGDYQGSCQQKAPFLHGLNESHTGSGEGLSGRSGAASSSP